MKQLMGPGNKSKIATSITLALLLSISPKILADNNPNWARGYIGNLNFRLNQDEDLSQRIRRVEVAKTALNQAQQREKAKKQNVNNLKTKKQEANQEVTKLGNQISKAITEQGNLKKEITKNEQALPNAERLQAQADNKVNKKTKEVKDLEQTLTKKKQRLDKQSQACEAEPTPACKKKVAELKQDVEVYTQSVAKAQKQLENLSENAKQEKKKVNQLKKKIAEQKAQVEKLGAEIATKNQKLVQSKASLKDLTQKLKVAQAELTKLQNETKNLSNALNIAQLDKEKFRERLIARVLDANKKGANEGSLDGESDGRYLSNRLGTHYGSRDGENDGINEGTRAGRERQRDIGYQEGQHDGAARAEQEGTAAGTIEGTYAGNVDAATKTGQVDGANRAQASDAAVVGANQGSAAGMQRAIRTGDQIGTENGKNEAIKKFETRKLDSKEVNGSFAGSFARVIPAFPSEHQGRNFNPQGGFARKIVEQAFKDGYKKRYRARLRSTYETVIPRIYNDTYTASYNNNYDVHYNRAYPSDRQAGYEQGQSDAYNRDYGVHYDNAYNRFRTQFSITPNTSAPEYQSTYARVENNVYESEYESIRATEYRRVETNTFNTNIAEQTEIFRKKKFESVSKIYSENPVLKFVSSSITDGGINGVAAKDGVFQPGETTYHDVVIQNFGDTEAKNVVVVMENGAKSTIASIPAKSITKVKGASKSTVNASLGKTDTKVVNVYLPLNAQADIQGRHYANLAQGKLNSGDRKSNRVNYPLALSSLSTNGTIIIGKNNSLSVKLSNNSKRSYQGELKLDITSNARSKVITKGFNSLTKLDRSTQLNDSVVNVSDEADIYTPITFNVKVSKNGVTLGVLDRALTTMAKAPYVEKAGKPVVVANSDYAANDLVDLLATMGGLQGASVLDTSLRSLNKTPLANGVKGKTLLLLEKGAIKDIDGMLKKSANTSVVLIDELQNGFGGIKSISTFKDAESFNFNVAGVDTNTKMIFANPLRASGLKTAVPVLASDIRSYKKYLALAELMKLSNDQILKKIESNVNKSSFFASSTANKQLMQMGIIRGIDETMRINKHYDLSGSGLGRDKDIANLLKDDKSLFHNRLGDLVDGKTRDSNVSLFLFAHDFYYTMRNALKFYDPIEDRVKFAIQNRMFGALFISAALKEVDKSYKALKKYDKKLYKQVSNNKGIHAPFEMAEERE
ncbi:hypothetical protein BIY24_06735 [Halobacteriovorax marinus]|uniref:hypothetical protein n=1 Tax=Halobacteriovorax marinus TaxID=97084 RepID=UPI000BC35CDF|nr:hypothetical protein [Halobacteriovorax marinus]ATH07649.1 hypothetical protein BIY24_06735 [Halobacteriovorax marinus]